MSVGQRALRLHRTRTRSWEDKTLACPNGDGPQKPRARHRIWEKDEKKEPKNGNQQTWRKIRLGSGAIVAGTVHWMLAWTVSRASLEIEKGGEGR